MWLQISFAKIVSTVGKCDFFKKDYYCLVPHNPFLFDKIWYRFDLAVMTKSIARATKWTSIFSQDLCPEMPILDHCAKPNKPEQGAVHFGHWKTCNYKISHWKLVNMNINLFQNSSVVFFTTLILWKASMLFSQNLLISV